MLAAMRRPMLGHLDPDFHLILDEVAAMLRAAWRMPAGDVLALPATGTTAMEAGLANLLEPGDTVVVGVAGFFGARLAEMAERQGARVVRVTAPLGRTVPNAALLDALDAHPEAHLVAVVHAETSTGALHPLRELGEALAGFDALLMADCVTSLGGVRSMRARGTSTTRTPARRSAWARRPAWRPWRSRRTPGSGSPAGARPCRSRSTWRRCARTGRERPATYHHTAPILAVYALHEALRCVLDRGAGAALGAARRGGGARWRGARGARARAARRPGVPARAADRRARAGGRRRTEVRARMLAGHGIEIGGGLGPDAPPIWRIGLMGRNASGAIAERVVDALDTVLEGSEAVALV